MKKFYLQILILLILLLLGATLLELGVSFQDIMNF
jgi:hypothetical protein